MCKFAKRLKNANAVIAQLKAGEWDFKYNELCNQCCTASRNGHKLWVSNGAWFCDVDEANAFGLLLRHYVWWRAAVWATMAANRRYRKKDIERIPKLYDA